MKGLANAIIITKNKDNHQHLFGLFVDAGELKEDENIKSYGAFTFKSESEDLEDVPHIVQKFWCIYAGSASVDDVGLRPHDPNEDSRPWEDGSGGVLEDTNIPFKQEAWMRCYFVRNDEPIPEGMYKPDSLEPEPEDN
jgi:hypothetical protein